MSLRSFATLLALTLVVFLAGCPGEPAPVDGGGVDAAGIDARAEVDGSSGCGGASDCDDGLFCNGPETCDPSDPDADADGCVAGTTPCTGSSAACDETANSCGSCSTSDDVDGDGARSIACGGADCDDNDPDRAPGHTEVCDAADLDEDCDATTYGFRDLDADGYADAACCNDTTCGDDCNDMRSTAHPSATEACDSFDNDCDTRVDEGVLESFFPDTDGDGFGAPSGTPVMACAVPAGYAPAAMATDCDDTMRSVNPAATEVCDAMMRDEDCDGTGNPLTLCTCNAGDPPRLCARPGLCASGNETCVGGAWGACSVMPVPEVCNGADDDCDSSIDEGRTVTCWADTDNDTYPDSLSTPMVAVCPDASRPTVGNCPNGRTNRAPTVATVDCGPSDSTVHPGGSESCNGVDDDCDGTPDEGTLIACYPDGDGDSYAPSGSSPAMVCACSSTQTTRVPAGAANIDCNDSLGSVRPGGTEVCNGLDDNCSGTADEGVGSVFYRDADGDGFGTATTTMTTCSAPSGYVSNSSDCNDTCGACYPGATEICDSRDNDCNGMTDEVILGTCTAGLGACRANGNLHCGGTCDAVPGPADTMYHAAPAPNGSWDWNCDGVTSGEAPIASSTYYTFTSYCPTRGVASCGGGYWLLESVPSVAAPYCGAMIQLSTCNIPSSTCAWSGTTPFRQAQRCR